MKGQPILPEYVKEYRDQSWSIEMLIAGGTVYSLFAVTDYMKSFFFDLYPVIEFDTYHIVLLFFLYLVTRILLFGFIANLVFRAIWLAYLGINFSFPKGINYDRLKASDFQKETLKLKPNIAERVIFLEKLCNLSYSLAILLSLFTTFLLLGVIFVIWLLNLMGLHELTGSSVFNYMLPFVIAMIYSGALDIFFKRTDPNSKVYRFKEGVSNVLDYLTLSFLFKREYLAIRTNTDRWLFNVGTNLIIILSLIVSSYQIGKYYPWGTLDLKFLDDRDYYEMPYLNKMYSSRYNENLTDKSKTFRASIQSEIVKENYLKLFLVSWSNFDRFLKYQFEEVHDYKKLKEVTSREKRDSMYANRDQIFDEVLNELFLIKIDKDTFGDLHWAKYKHPLTREEGYMTFVNIKDLDEDKGHELEVYTKYFGYKNDSIYTGRWVDIPFWISR